MPGRLTSPTIFTLTALGIPTDIFTNVVLFYSKINERLNYLEEAERGYKRTLELGECSLETWISRGDILLKLGELEAAKYNFVQALEQHPKSEELEFRIFELEQNVELLTKKISYNFCPDLFHYAPWIEIFNHA